MICYCPYCLLRNKSNHELNFQLLNMLFEFSSQNFSDFAKLYYDVNINGSAAMRKRTTAIKKLNSFDFLCEFANQIRFQKFNYIDIKTKEFKQLTKEQQQQETLNKQINRDNLNYPSTLIEDLKDYFEKFIK